jgi:hypothetical protein
MGGLSEHELELEVLIHEGSSIPDLFKTWQEIRGDIAKMRDYLSALVTEYEERPSSRVDADEVSCGDLPRLSDMLHGSKEGPFRKRFTSPFHDALSKIQIERARG